LPDLDPAIAKVKNIQKDGGVFPFDYAQGKLNCSGTYLAKLDRTDFVDLKRSQPSYKLSWLYDG
jgi:hypothetical protein